ncbi:hypothetical protein [Dongia sp.]
MNTPQAAPLPQTTPPDGPIVEAGPVNESRLNVVAVATVCLAILAGL